MDFLYVVAPALLVLAGILGGYVTGLLSGILISIPAMLNGELLTMPLLATIARSN